MLSLFSFSFSPLPTHKNMYVHICYTYSLPSFHLCSSCTFSVALVFSLKKLKNDVAVLFPSCFLHSIYNKFMCESPINPRLHLFITTTTNTHAQNKTKKKKRIHNPLSSFFFFSLLRSLYFSPSLFGVSARVPPCRLPGPLRGHNRHQRSRTPTRTYPITSFTLSTA